MTPRGEAESTARPGAPASRDALAPEDQARADFYALLARLYSDGPTAELLAAIAAAPPVDGVQGVLDDDAETQDIGAAWRALAAASASTPAAAACQEYADLFIGVGRSELNLHASHWLTGFMMEKPLADVRATLVALGLARREKATVVEDHLAALCETMRILVAGQGERPPASLAQQRDFFERHVAPWALRCCGAIKNCPVANYYRTVAQFTYCYLLLERESLAME